MSPINKILFIAGLLALFLAGRPGPPPSKAAPGVRYRQFLDGLAARNVQVVVVPVPVPPIDEKAYRRLVRASLDHTLDLLAVFDDYARRSPGARFFPPDGPSHWTSLAIALAARAVAQRLGIPAEIVYENKLVPVPPSRWYEPVYDVRGPPLGKQRVLLAGGANSLHLKESGFGFGDLLGRALGREPFEVTMAGDGGLRSLRMIAEQGWIFQPNDVLVWELDANEAPDDASAFPALFVGDSRSK